MRPDSHEPTPLWRSPALLRAAGQTLRPGGFALTDRACELAGLRPGWPVLDVGCGRGATLLRLRTRYGAQALGVDPDPIQGPNQGSQAASRYMVRGTAQDLPFPSGGFHMLFCECVLSLTPDPARALAEFARVLRPGGILALSDLYLRRGDSCGCDDGQIPGTGEPQDASADQAAPLAYNSCTDGALSRAALEGLLSEAGFLMRLFEDHSAHLRNLAAKLLWQGCAPSCASNTTTTGYCLILAVAGEPYTHEADHERRPDL